MLTLRRYLLNKCEAAGILGLFGRKGTIEMAEEEVGGRKKEGKNGERRERRKPSSTSPYLPKSIF